MANTTDVEVVRYVADVSGLEAGQRQLEANLLKSKTSADALNRSLKENTQSAKLYKDRLAELDAEFKKNGKLSAEAELEQKKLKSAVDSVSKAIISQKVRLKELENSTKTFNEEVKKTTPILKDTEEQSKKSNSALSGLAKTFIAFFAFNQIKQFIKQIFDVTAEFQKFEAVLTNTLGSNSLAKKALNDILQFTKETPFGVQEVTGAFVKLANQGFTPTIAQLRKLGDLVASTGKTFDQLAEALLDAQQGQYRRLLEFGIRAEKQGDKVAFTFKGVKTVVDDNAESIRNFIVGLGDFEGVAGASVAVAETLGGKIEKLGDSFDQFLLKLGEGRLKTLFSGFVDGLSNVLDLATDLIKTYEQRQQDNTDKFVADRVAKQNEVDNLAIQKLVEDGKTKLEAEKEYFTQREKETADAAKILEDNILSQRYAISAQVQKIQDLNNTVMLKKDRDVLIAEIKQNIDSDKKYLRNLEVNLALRQFQRDQYNKNLIDNERSANSAKDKLAEEEAKNAKKRTDDEARAFALQEQQRRAYNDFSISLIENQFDREAATLKEQFFRKIEDSKKNIGVEITTNSEEYKRLNDELIRQLQANEVKRKEFEDAQAAARVKAIIDRVNKEIKAQEDAGNNSRAYELKQVRDAYEAELAEGVKYSKAKEKLDSNIARKTFETKNNSLNAEIELLETESVKYQDGSQEKIEINKRLGAAILEQDRLAFDERERLRKEDLKAEELAAQKKAAAQTAAINVVTAALNAAIDLRLQAQTAEIAEEQEKLDAKAQADKDRIDRQVESGYISQKRAAQLKNEVDKEAAKKEQALKLRQFKADQQAAVSRALLNGALAVVNALATVAYPANLIAAAGIAAVTAIEVGVIKSQKPPKYKDGIIDMPGKGTGTSDSNPAMLSKGESVMTAKETKKYKPELEAIRAGTFEQLMKQKYSTEEMSFLPYDRQQKNKQSEYTRRSEADRARRERESQLDMSKMESLTKANRNIGVRNADEIGRAVARHMPVQKTYRP